jgi:hypothetical protein
MSDEFDWDFAGADDAKAEIRAAIRYLLKGATGGARGDIVQAIIAIVRQVSSEPPGPPDSIRRFARRLILGLPMTLGGPLVQWRSHQNYLFAKSSLKHTIWRRQTPCRFLKAGLVRPIQSSGFPKVAETRTGFPSCSRGRSWIDGWSSAKRGRKV